MTMAEWKIIDLEQGLEFIQKGIKKLVSEQPINSEEYMQIYTTVYNLCTEKPPHDYPKQLYDRYRKSIEDYIADMVLPALRKTPSEFFWGELMKRCEYYTTVVSWLIRFFGYLDRHFVIRRSLPTLNEVGLTCFRDLVHQEMKDKIKDAVITLIDGESEGNKIDRDMLEKVDSIIVEFGNGCIGKDFEVAILEVAATYYSGKAPLWFNDKSYQAYLEQVNECLDRLENRVKRDLRSPSKQKWLEKVQSELLSPYKSQLLENGDSDCRTLLRDGKVKELSDMYKLFHRIPEGLARIFKEHVTGEVTSLVKRAEDAATNKKAEKDMVGAQVQALVREVIDSYAKYLQYVSECFGNCTRFYVALKEAFELFCNKGVAGSTGAELLATFCDNILKRGGSENTSNENIQDTLEKVVMFVVNISDKDLFEEFYREKLARRLLFDKSAEYDHKSLLTKLKQHCGIQITSKIERMIKDSTLAKENQGHFDNYLNINPHENPGIDLTLRLLSAGSWPSYKSCDLNLPAEMVRCKEVFKQFYQKRTENRKKKLTWIYSLGTCIINGKFDPQPKELVVTTYQASALLLFNASERLSYSEVKSQLNLTDEDIATLLHSLSCAKYKILNKEPNTKTVTPTDYFEFNSKFTDERKIIQIPPPLVYERKKVIKDVVRDRRHEINASIVRIMKKRKVLGHKKLVEECHGELGQTVKPDPKAIKKQIDDLITREYLERDKDKSYRYLA